MSAQASDYYYYVSPNKVWGRLRGALESGSSKVLEFWVGLASGEGSRKARFRVDPGVRFELGCKVPRDLGVL